MKKIIIGGIIGILLFGSVPAVAEEGQQSSFEEIDALLDEMKTELTIVSDYPIANCRETLVPLYDIEAMQFLLFLEENFQNKASSSSLTNIAIARYIDYKNDILDVFNEQVTPHVLRRGEANLHADESAAYEHCYEITDSYIDLMKQRMIMHIKDNNYQKKTIILVDKYKSINDGLADLNFAVAEMYGYFMTFRNKLPGFLTECIKQ